MYLRTIALFSVAFALILTTGLTRNSNHQRPIDYVAREALPDDLPEIPGPPRSAKRTLYDTLRGVERTGEPAPRASSPAVPAQSAPAPSKSGKELPLLPVRSAPAPARGSAGPVAPEAGSLERVAEPVPAASATSSNADRSRTGDAGNRTAAAGDANATGADERPREPIAKRSRKPVAEPAAKKGHGRTQKSEPERRSGSGQERSTASTNRANNQKAGTTAAKASTVNRKAATVSAAKAVPGSRRTIGKHDPKIEPTSRGEFRYYAPDYYRGIYLNNGVVHNKKRYQRLFEQSRKHKVNVLVADVQPRFPGKDFIRAAREGGFYLVARVVVFEGGLKQPRVPEKHLSKVLDAAEQAARAGFMEIQLDYIRFADRARIGNLNLKQRYHIIADILKRATDRLRPLGVRIGADIFGRIPFNQNDRIGQRMEVFAAHLDTLYPMLYPSHFYGDPSYIRDPYKTIYQGQKKSIARVGDTTRIIAYIQGFKMKVGPSGLSYHNYIRKQLDAAADSGGAGFVVWNARSAYGPFFKALADHDRRRARSR